MTTLLEHDPNLDITVKVVSAITRSYLPNDDKQRMVELLLRYEKKIEFNEEVRTANWKERTRERSIGKSSTMNSNFR